MKNRERTNTTYSDITLYEAIRDISLKHPDNNAHIFLGQKTTYKNFFNNINCCAKALKSLGIKSGDNIAIVMPNSPQALELFYATNALGAISNMVHPLSSVSEINYYLKLTGARLVLTLDLFAEKVEATLDKTSVENLVVTSISDALSPTKKLLLKLSLKQKGFRKKGSINVINWAKFFSLGKSYNGQFRSTRNSENEAIVLYSGGTTGTPKGVRLSNFAINALVAQFSEINPKFKVGDVVFSGMPIFHSFGLIMTCHVVLAHGGCCLLVPRFNMNTVIKDIVKYKCTLIAGVPTLFEAILKASKGKKYDLSFLKEVFCGGDALSVDLENRFNNFLSNNNTSVKIRPGYGLTESVFAVTVVHDKSKPESSGLPLSDMKIKICIPGTHTQVPTGQTGEICVCGPTLMMGYLNNPEETENALQKHSDNKIWLHTGDLGYLDSEGYLFVVQRLKRMIISSGYNVYPAQLEKVINQHKYVKECCVIGVPDTYKGHKAKAYIVLNSGIEKSGKTKDELIDYFKKHIAKFAIPKDIEFRDSLPTTVIGKVDYRSLENEEL